MPDLAAVAAAAAAKLSRAGEATDEAARDAVLLARSILDWTAADWLTRSREPASNTVAEALDALVVRRARHEPIAYLTGRREFYGRDFVVSPAVLIPRPETELLVEEAIRAIDECIAANGRPADVIDVGTGSGCVAVTIAIERPSASITTTDVSAAALDVARTNARRHGVDDRVSLVEGSLLAACGPWDVIVSNPPYVALDDRSSLAPDVVLFEPHVALFGGDDGLDVIRALVNDAARGLRHGGWLIMEIGAGQSTRVRALIDATGALDCTTIAADLQSIPRVIVARRR